VPSLKLAQRQRGEIEMEDHDIRAALDRHWAASDANDFEAEHQIYREDAVLEYPQSGEPSAAGATFRRLALLSRAASASQCGGYSVVPTSGSLNSCSLTTGGRLTR
jgi:hypothetical protein